MPQLIAKTRCQYRNLQTNSIYLQFHPQRQNVFCGCAMETLLQYYILLDMYLNWVLTLDVSSRSNYMVVIVHISWALLKLKVLF